MPASAVTISSAERLRRLVGLLVNRLDTALSIVAFTGGVTLGTQLGVGIVCHIPPRVLERGLGVLFIVVVALRLGEVIL